MKLRIILIALSLLAFFSASTGGYLYYSSSKNAVFRETERKATLHVETIRNHLPPFLSEGLKSVQALASSTFQDVSTDSYEEPLKERRKQLAGTLSGG